MVSLETPVASRSNGMLQNIVAFGNDSQFICQINCVYGYIVGYEFVDGPYNEYGILNQLDSNCVEVSRSNYEDVICDILSKAGYYPILADK